MHLWFLLLTQAFHVFHVSCLIHWILLCELETYKPVDEPKMETKAKRRSKRKTGTKRSAKVKKDEIKAARQIYSVFCPECQGTGISIEEGDELEKPIVSLSEVCKQPAIFHSSFSTYNLTYLFAPPTPKGNRKRETKMDAFFCFFTCLDSC